MARYENEEPITDVRHVMELMSPKMGRWAGSHLSDGYLLGGQAFVEVSWEGREYSDGTTERYLVDQKCFNEIKEKGWASGTPMLGYTDYHKLRLNENGSRQLMQWNEQDKQAAKDLLVPGEHGWSSIFNYRGKRDLRRGEPRDWKEGYVFENPAGQFFLVLLKEKEVVRVDNTCNPL